ncbi:Phosphate acetyltransferase [Alloiococcus otitis]|uniref:Phosphate acetyltransferase n=1 Tax=Alloiococcus otitis ATCC 51267 TaxID=883081 RepID=K9E8G3_9LACT|nr:phosphate acetyltransferase [Alloiococcus otitis]EKU92943.1 phosphate acetyltransferase [Alloiococcus otitis ATCC 51267]SUU80454.1 Phosphate acetyltransferase [Alloiococcus otitis]
MEIIESLKDKVKGKGVRIVFPEALDERILQAVVRLKKEGLITPILLGNPNQVNAKAKEFGFNIDGLTILDPENYDEFDDLVASFVERRKGKATEEDAKKILKDVNYFGTMLVYTDRADGLVSGAVHSTGDTVRPALQIIKTKEGVSRTSGAFLMLRGRGQERYIFADCAINPDPDKDVLAEIAIESAKTAKMFDIDPKVALLSFSTKGSAGGDQVDKVAQASEIVKEKDPDLAVDGELQFDAAFVNTVAKQKAPDSDVAGEANVFVFPELQSGNIGYKIAQRFGNFEAIGPVLQGLNKPISDLSRGCSSEDVYNLSLVTATQAIAED